MSKKICAVAIMLLALGVEPLLAQTFDLDKNHSSVEFSIRHILTKVKGRFTEFSGQIVYDSANVGNSSVNVTIQTASINTDNDNRNNHLKSPDFFDAEKFPEITFHSTKVFKQDDQLMLTGLLNMHGVEKEITFPFEVLGILQTGERLSGGFEGGLKLNRTDYGITWNRALELGGALLGDEVTIDLNIEAKEPRQETEKK